MAAALFKFAERVHKAGVHERGEAVAFLDGEAVVADIGLGIGKVYFRMRYIQVATKNHRLPLFQSF